MIIPKGYKLVPVELLEKLSALWPDGAENDGSSRFGWLPHVSEAVRNLKAIASDPTPLQPIYDEEREWELFESFQVDEGGNIDFEDGYYDKVFVQSAWDGWKACAQSRAKSVEVKSD